MTSFHFRTLYTCKGRVCENLSFSLPSANTGKHELPHCHVRAQRPVLNSRPLIIIRINTVHNKRQCPTQVRYTGIYRWSR